MLILSYSCAKIPYMYAAIDAPYRPYRRQPAEHERPSCGPGSQITGLGKYEVAVIPPVPGTNGKRYNRGGDKNEIHGHEDCL